MRAHSSTVIGGLPLDLSAVARPSALRLGGHHRAAFGPGENIASGGERQRVETRVLADVRGEVLVERAHVALVRRHAGEDAAVGSMTAADARMVEAGDDGKTVAEPIEERQVFRGLVARARALRHQRIVVNAERDIDEQQASRPGLRIRRMGETAERFEPRQAEHGGGGFQKMAAGDEWKPQRWDGRRGGM